MIPADITFQDSTPLARGFDDIYYNPNDALGEVEYVFLRGNLLMERFKSLDPADARPFTIAETGLGTGLNLLMAWAWFRRYAPDGAQLHVISVEKHPLRAEDLRQALAPFRAALDGEMAALVDRFCDIYPPLTQGFHHRWLDDRVRLTVIFDDATQGYAQLGSDGRVDAWFLDGFAPAKNKDMWSSQLFNEIARLSHQQTSLATFTAVGAVRRALADVGFQIKKHKGFGRKREMVTATATKQMKPPPKLGYLPRHVHIIGAGLAGAALTQAFRRRHVAVTVFEQSPDKQALTAGSGNTVGLLNPKLSLAPTVPATLSQAGFSFTRHLLNDLAETARNAVAWRETGILHLWQTPERAERYQKLHSALSWYSQYFQKLGRESLSDIFNSSVTGASLVPHGGSFNPSAWVTQQLGDVEVIRQNGIDPELPCAIKAWAIKDDKIDIPSYLCTGVSTATVLAKLGLDIPLPIRTIRGQTTKLRITDQKLRQAWPHALSFGGYTSAPDADGTVMLGASFDRRRAHAEVLDEDIHDNMLKLKMISPLAFDCSKPLSHWSGVRATLPDHAPVVGEVAPSLGLFAGLGSHGSCFAPIVAEHILSQLEGGISPLPQWVVQSVKPQRFWKVSDS